MQNEWVPQLTEWYTQNARDLPWRRTSDPYRIWVSEIMLQQTRVEAVKTYYLRFIQRYPDIPSLASADDDELLKLWEGLGYYSRVRNMKRAAERIADSGKNALPADYDGLLALPGIGSYTAGAIASIAYRLPVPAVDGNVLRVLARLHEDPSDVKSPAFRRKAETFLKSVIPPDMPGTFNQALMELGATVCLPSGAPLCGGCPLHSHCAAHQNGSEQKYPLKQSKPSRRTENKTVFALSLNGRYLGYRRPEHGLLAGLYQLPDEVSFLPDESFLPYLKGHGLNPAGEIRIYSRKHVFTHMEWHMKVFAVSVSLLADRLPEGWLSLDPDLHSLPTAYRICLPDHDS
ncbi:MAG: A/G-specific adenine glycosylase [Clostridia bacterium]|nr:A/G-specific adenine glycosylase [Clostridia bacterium]